MAIMLVRRLSSNSVPKPSDPRHLYCWQFHRVSRAFAGGTLCGTATVGKS